MDKRVIINIGRQLGSGGHDIGRMLALDFNAKYYDRELLNLAAKESGFSAEFFEQNDEKKGFLRSFLQLPFSIIHNGANFYQNNFSQEGLFKFQSDAIRKAASEGSCVFLGRCADYVLRDFPNVVNVFVTASIDFRIRQVMDKQNVSKEEAQRIIEEGESERAAYYDYYTGKKWGHATSYDLCVDSSILGLVETEKFIAEFVRAKLNVKSNNHVL
ncbi:AAA family ATPase [Prevotella sp. E13-27]|uniref:cytidylate kinase-like family protein n=1 Tax=Prevotella sp. E13-27 TaxID=2938122 RepID=UPI002009DF60|nr:cytidylate kinase-like family protein [Prevotella sp. E13-27]MCK8622592.1 cytidylate kinase-like family protein [Prevotella sp. E13-27]